MNWNELTVKQYYEIQSILEEVDEPIELNTRLIDTIWNVSSADMPYTKFLYYMNELDFLKEPYKASQPKKRYEVKGEVFTTMLDVSKLTTAQYLDYIALLEAKDYKRLLNCLFIKEGEQYGDNDYSELLWNNLTLDCYADTLFFFRNSLTTLTHNILTSSLRKMRRQVRRVRKEERLPYLRKMIQIKQALLLVEDE